ncbi:BamA/TamA family outer membrane protein [Hymenobacter sp. 15J16-1T3B]|uniref:BamA/TamA family outer membrane protein n=1 Tax=Hymenobacter sp. 15J16-1T3B TaxID=2886941 RepID=UPI001D118156|nr:BamA/TamA family outer membrane protein [Hymenobacter sp. 15J16-1T3B]MCC3157508.1 BamA/TamA family outer membrane protein [Hymenobacter sp. 15J16-1T3B]
MRIFQWWGLMSAGLLAGAPAAAQSTEAERLVVPDSLHRPTPPETDLPDVLRRAFPRLIPARDTTPPAPGHKYIVVLPVVSYSLTTRGLVQLTSSTAFREEDANMSSLVAALTYTQNRQLILNATPSIWTTGNRYNLVGDWRLMRYPQATYGLGMHNRPADAVQMNYDYLRIYQSVLRQLRPNLYAGLGYQLDYHWDIRSARNEQPVSSVSEYRRGVRGRSVSSGLALTALYDSRGNAINPPAGGSYLSLQLRPNFRQLGSDAAYQSLLVDVRKYLRLREGSRNVLALWSYNAFVFGNGAPYLDLPSTGWDMYNNTGRGYIQGRFRGQGLLYTEAEYRFGITRNRLLGGVVFVNAQSASEPGGHRFEQVAPAGGVGLRLNMNKLSRTNLTVDYGIGRQGSRGLWFNFGEVF